MKQHVAMMMIRVSVSLVCMKVFALSSMKRTHLEVGHCRLAAHAQTSGLVIHATFLQMGVRAPHAKTAAFAYLDSSMQLCQQADIAACATLRGISITQLIMTAASTEMSAISQTTKIGGRHVRTVEFAFRRIARRFRTRQQM
jgi:hypothetical protein